jgi:hypothetical protein
MHRSKNRAARIVGAPFAWRNASNETVVRYPTFQRKYDERSWCYARVAMENVPREPEPTRDPWDAIKAIALEVCALVRDEASGELSYNGDPEADKQVYAKAFHDWGAGNIDGSAQVIFATVREILEL